MIFIAQTLEAIKLMKRMIDYQCNNETTQDSLTQIEPPIIIDEKKNDFIAPGEMGNGLEIARGKLLPDDIRKYDDGLEKNAFNVFASDLISKHRTLPEI
jgi:hypothetical protein